MEKKSREVITKTGQELEQKAQEIKQVIEQSKENVAESARQTIQTTVDQAKHKIVTDLTEATTRSMENQTRQEVANQLAGRIQIAVDDTIIDRAKEMIVTDVKEELRDIHRHATRTANLTKRINIRTAELEQKVETKLEVNELLSHRVFNCENKIDNMNKEINVIMDRVGEIIENGGDQGIKDIEAVKANVQGLEHEVKEMHTEVRGLRAQLNDFMNYVTPLLERIKQTWGE